MKDTKLFKFQSNVWTLKKRIVGMIKIKERETNVCAKYHAIIIVNYRRSYYEGGGEKREERKKERCRWFFSQTVEKEY